jgi:hypothetical protein
VSVKDAHRRASWALALRAVRCVRLILGLLYPLTVTGVAQLIAPARLTAHRSRSTAAMWRRP